MLKTWILHTFFQKELNNARFEGSKDAFEKAREDLEETMVETDREKIEEAADRKLNELLSIIDHRHIVTKDSRTGVVSIGGEIADAGRLSVLKAEAELIKNTALWKIINESIKNDAQLSMFIKGESVDDMKKGRSMLYTLSLQNKVIELFESVVIKN